MEQLAVLCLFFGLGLNFGVADSACPGGCLCTLDQGGWTSMSCVGDTIPSPIQSDVKSLVLEFVAKRTIPKNALRGLRNMKLIQIGGHIDKIENGAITDITGVEDSEFRLAGSIDIIEGGAFDDISDFTTFKLDGMLIDTIETFGFQNLLVSAFTIEGSIIQQIEPYAFENAQIAEFQVLRTSINTLQPCGFGGVQGAANFILYFSPISLVQAYGFGGITNIHTFTLDQVNIEGGNERALQGMTNVNTINIHGNGNQLPDPLTSPGLFVSDIRQRCLGYTTSLTTSEPPDTTRSSGSTGITALTPELGSWPNVSRGTEDPDVSSGSAPTTAVKGASKHPQKSSPSGTTTTPSLSNVEGGNGTREGNGSNDTNGPNQAGASKGSTDSSNDLKTSEIILIVILILLVLIITLMTIFAVLYWKKRRNKVRPDTDLDNKKSENSSEPATEPETTMTGEFYFDDREDLTTEDLVPRRKKKRKSKYKGNNLPENAEISNRTIGRSEPRF